MRGISKALGIRNRVVWVGDSIEGLPEPDAEKYPIEEDISGTRDKEGLQALCRWIGGVQHNFEGYGLLDQHVCFLKGWFKDT
jgi:hypothetical protein